MGHSAGLQVILRESCSTCSCSFSVSVGGGELGVLLLCHLGPASIPEFQILKIFTKKTLKIWIIHYLYMMSIVWAASVLCSSARQQWKHGKGMKILNCKYFLWKIIISHVYSEMSILEFQQFLRLNAILSCWGSIMCQALSLSDCELKNQMCTRCCGLLLLDPRHLVQTCKNKTKPGT